MSDSKGLKYDQGKNLMSLLFAGCSRCLIGVSKILTYGATKYEPNGWKSVDEERYLDAFYRHMMAFHSGEECDKESGLPHLHHAITNLIFISEKRMDKGLDKGVNLPELIRRASEQKK